MRKQKKIILWPAYFDSSRTRKEGRKVPKTLAVSNPNLTELQKAAEHLRLRPEVEADSTHPAISWRKTGRIWVQRKGTKMQTLIKVAREMIAIRQQAKK